MIFHLLNIFMITNARLNIPLNMAHCHTCGIAARTRAVSSRDYQGANCYQNLTSSE